MAEGKYIEKAYKNLEFLTGPAARTIRMICEYTEPQTRFEKYGVKNTIVFFGSARIHSGETVRKELREVEELIADSDPSAELMENKSVLEAKLKMSRYYDEAAELSEALTIWSKSLPQEKRFDICSGGGPGIMEAANLGAFRAAGKSIGLNISLPFEQTPNPYISENLGFEFHYFFMRKFWFIHLAKVLIVFPGGFGTFDELFEVLTLQQTEKLANKVPVVMYGSEYWRRAVNFDFMVEQGTIGQGDLDLFEFADTPQEALDCIKRKLTAESD